MPFWLVRREAGKGVGPLNSKTPRFSVIVPTHERPEALRRCLEGFANLDHSSWDLIVVNDGGANSFRKVDEGLRSRLPLRLVDAPHAGPASARNLGARLAQGEFLAFTDDDCIPEPDWLTAFERGFETTDADVLVGECLNPHAGNVPAMTWQLYLAFMFELSRDKAGNALMVPSNNVAYRREAFWSVGGFDDSFPTAAGEDMDLAYRIVEHGYRQRHLDSARVWHDHRNTIRGYLNQQLRYGRGTRDLLRRNHAVAATKTSRWTHYANLMAFLRRHRAPLGVFLLAAVTPVVHRIGIESSRWRRKRTSTD
jgi:cellulose synthase/poly-beta-1,6-N-acetylglucosamine synthase-like glycosyltransferase